MWFGSAEYMTVIESSLSVIMTCVIDYSYNNHQSIDQETGFDSKNGCVEELRWEIDPYPQESRCWKLYGSHALIWSFCDSVARRLVVVPLGCARFPPLPFRNFGFSLGDLEALEVLYPARLASSATSTSWSWPWKTVHQMLAGHGVIRVLLAGPWHVDSDWFWWGRRKECIYWPWSYFNCVTDLIFKIRCNYTQIGCKPLVTMVVKLVAFFKGSLNRLDLLRTGAPTYGGTAGDESPMTINDHGDHSSYSQLCAAGITWCCGLWQLESTESGILWCFSSVL